MSCLFPFRVLAIKYTCMDTAEFFSRFTYLFISVSFNSSVRIRDYLLVFDPCLKLSPMDLEFQDVTHFFIFLWFLFYYATHFLQCHQYTVICRHLGIPVRIHYAVLFLFLSNYHQQILPSFQEVKFILQQVVREISFYVSKFL